MSEPDDIEATIEELWAEILKIGCKPVLEVRLTEDLVRILEQSAELSDEP